MTKKQKAALETVLYAQQQAQEAYKTMDEAMLTLAPLAGQTVELVADGDEYEIIDNFVTDKVTIFKAAAFRRYEVKPVK